MPLHELEHKHQQAEKERMWTALAAEDGTDPGNPVDQEINRLYMTIMMRARMNTQRHYEVYTVQTDRSIDADDLVRMFNDNPQGMADLIRERGQKLYSARASHAPVIV